MPNMPAQNAGHFQRPSVQIRRMINNPMVRLFSGKNLTGDSEEYHSGQKLHGCLTAPKNPIVKSAETFVTDTKDTQRNSLKHLRGRFLSFFQNATPVVNLMEVHLSLVLSY
ncbi:unnamed protein product [Allacma fusca]|uniref:Uncharacterized protein n=1 Tax=Allacma fusca TaxID=39272 RepID=A0A8J2KTT7_9HEXA|nr:unnamed protein product [Allacma fusca]